MVWGVNLVNDRMKKIIYLIIALIPLLSIPGYKLFTENFKIELSSKKQVVDIPSPASTFTPTTLSTPTPLSPQIIYKVPDPTVEPTKLPQQQTSQVSIETTCRATTDAIKANIKEKMGNNSYGSAYAEREMARFYLYCLSNPNKLNDFQLMPPTGVNTNSGLNINTNDLSANESKDSQGVLCSNMTSRCKYECSIFDYEATTPLRCKRI